MKKEGNAFVQVIPFDITSIMKEDVLKLLLLKPLEVFATFE
jgi:hypothetical protein